MQKQVDILEFSSSQLAPLIWSECTGPMPMTTKMHDAQAVLLRGNLYVRGGYSVSLTPKDDNSKLYMYTLTANVWEVLDTPVYWFALATYHSQLVLVGGDDVTVEDPVLTNKLFTRAFNERWLETLPPLPKKCRLSLAVSSGDFLFVVGGWDDDQGWLGILQIFNGHYWAQTRSPPLPYFDIKSAILDGVWYLAPGPEEEEQRVYYTSLESLIVSCHSVDILNYVTWRSLPAVPCKFSSLAVFGNRLIAVGRNIGGPLSPNSAIHAYSPSTKSWVHVANLAIGWYATSCVVVHPLGELLVVGGSNRLLQVFKGRVEGVINHKKEGNNGEMEVEIQNDLKNILEHEKDVDLKEKVTGFIKKLSNHCQIEMVSQAKSSGVKLPTAATWNLRGVEVCGEMTVEVQSSHCQQITWEGFGLNLHIPEGSLPEGMERCSIQIRASLAGQYEFPKNSHLISAIFWLRCGTVSKFAKPITVEIQHCAKSENITNLELSFVRAICSQKQLPYTFKQLSGGIFTSHSSYGVIELNSFSGVGITQKGLTQEGLVERQYYSKLFYFSNYFGGHRIDLTVTWNTRAHINAMKRHYRKEGALAGPDQPVEFEGEEIRLDLPMEEMKINERWTIVPLIDPVVTKNEVDSYLPGRRLPHCELAAHPLGESVTRLVHQLILLGAKPPRNKFTLSYMPPTAQEVLAVGHPPASLATESAKPKLKDLQKELYSKVADKWEDIGIQLDIEDGQLSRINLDKAGDSKACLREILRVWLSRVAPPPSWSAMADALDTLGHQDIAVHLRTVYMN